MLSSERLVLFPLRDQLLLSPRCLDPERAVVHDVRPFVDVGGWLLWPDAALRAVWQGDELGVGHRCWLRLDHRLNIGEPKLFDRLRLWKFRLRFGEFVLTLHRGNRIRVRVGDSLDLFLSSSREYPA